MMTDPESRRPSIDERFAEYCRRVDQGESFDRQKFLDECAEDSDEVADLLEVVAMVDQMAGPTAEEVSAETVVWGEDRTDPGTLGIGNDEPDLPFQIGDYVLKKKIGSGGMGAVYEARQLSLDRSVAVKMILSGRFASPEDRTRFHMEARAAGRLNHPNIVDVFEVQFIDGHDFFSMSLIEGPGLNEFVDENSPLDPKRAARYIRDIANAIETAHQKGLVHRDLKPGNILVDQDDQVHITDFGLSKEIDSDIDLTATGMAVGTPTYMAPEQATRGGDAPSADVYSLGATLYALLVGRPPFKGETTFDTLIEARTKEPEPVRKLNADVDQNLETICLKCLEKEPADRYASASDLAKDLDRYLNNEPIAARRTMWHVRFLHNVSKEMSRRVVIVGGLLLVAFTVAAYAVGVFRGGSTSVEGYRIASGESMGAYHDFSRELGKALEQKWNRVEHVEVQETNGSVANVQLVAAGKAFLGLSQKDALPTKNVVVMAPLFTDVVCVASRIKYGSLNQLVDKEVVIGKENSGMVLTATRLLDFLKPRIGRLIPRVGPFEDLNLDDSLAGAIITSRLANRKLNIVLSNQFKLHSIPEARSLTKEDPRFVVHTIMPGDVSKSWNIPPTGIETVSTTTYLICNKNSPDAQVKRVLEILYRESNLVTQMKLIPPNVVDLDQVEGEGLDLHAAAKKFFVAQSRK